MIHYRQSTCSVYLKCFENTLSHASRLLNSRETDKIGVISCALALLSFGLNATADTKDCCCSKVKKFIQKWLSKDAVIGGTMFGGSWDWYYKKLQKKDAEIKV